MPIELSSTVGSVKSAFVFIGPAIVAFVRRKLGNFYESRKLQTVQAHKIEHQKPRWHTGYKPSVSMCGPTFKAQHWHLSYSEAQCWRQDVYHVVVSYFIILTFYLNHDPR